jgi:hypothetical protein
VPCQPADLFLGLRNVQKMVAQESRRYGGRHRRGKQDRENPPGSSIHRFGAISMQLRRPVVWNPLTEEFGNDDDANRLKARALREPWTL